MFAAAGNLPRLRPAGGGRFFFLRAEAHAGKRRAAAERKSGTRFGRGRRGHVASRSAGRRALCPPGSGTGVLPAYVALWGCFATCGGHLPAGERDGCCLLACGGLAIRRVTPNAPFRPGAKAASSISKGRFVGPPASAPTRRLRPTPSRRMQGAKKGRRNADGQKMTL